MPKTPIQALSSQNGSGSGAFSSGHIMHNIPGATHKLAQSIRAAGWLFTGLAALPLPMLLQRTARNRSQHSNPSR
jgi:iron complex outermembrane receptor protein